MYQTAVVFFPGGIELIDLSNYLLIQWENIARLDVR
jgi:hypothetical protein